MKVQRSGSSFSASMLAGAAAACLFAFTASASPTSDHAVTGTQADPVSPIVLFFEPGSAEVPASARPLANRALGEGLGTWRWRLDVAPFVAADGDDKAKALAEERARNVAAFLEANGIPKWRVETTPVTVAEIADPGFDIAGNRVEVQFTPAADPAVADLR